MPNFCPQRLINYRSMDMTDAFDYPRAPPIEGLEIRPGDHSKRLSNDQLAKTWAARSQEARPPLPIWAKSDGILQRIMASNQRSGPSQYGVRSSPTISSGGSTDEIIAPAASAFPVDTVISEEEPNGHLAMEISQPYESSPALLPTQPPSQSSQPSRKPDLARNRARTSRIEKTLPAPRTPRRRTRERARRADVIDRHRMQTRSRRSTTFYELGSRGRPQACSNTTRRSSRFSSTVTQR